MLELCPTCGAVQTHGEPHVCWQEPRGTAAQGPSLDIDRGSGPAPAPRRTTSAIGLAHAGEDLDMSPLVWRFVTTDGRDPIVVDLYPSSTIETVRIAGRIVSRSTRGGMPGGHAFRIGATPAGADGTAEPQPYRAAAAPGECRVRIDPALRTCTLTVDGVALAPLSSPSPAASPARRPPPAAAVAPSTSGSPWSLVVAAGVALAVIGVSFAVGRAGMVALASLGFLIALVGGCVILVAAFSESVTWGLACMLLPGAALFFVASHWDRSRRGAAMWALGATLLFVSGGGSAYLARRDGPDASGPDPAAAPPRPTSGVACISLPTPPEGFSAWCCTPKGWLAIHRKGCTSIPKPTDDCDEASVGKSSVEPCGTVGTPDRRYQ